MAPENQRTITVQEVINLIVNTTIHIPSHVPTVLKAKDFSIRISASTGQLTVTIQKGLLLLSPNVTGRRIRLVRPGSQIATTALCFNGDGKAILRSPPTGYFSMTMK